MSESGPSFLHPSSFERNVLTAMAVAVAVGCAHVILTGIFGLPSFPDGTTGAVTGLPALVLLATVLTCAAGDRTDRMMLRLASLLAIPMPFLWHAAPVWKLALAGAIAGPLMVQAQLCERGERGQIGSDRPGRWSFALAALASAVLAPIGVAVAQILAWRLDDLAAPPVILGPLSAAVIALFVAIGALPAHLGLAPDPAGGRLNALLARADGDLRRLVQRALESYGRCSQGLAALPREPAREALARTVGGIATEIADLGERFLKLEPVWGQVGGADTEQEIARLVKVRARSTDPVARAQLALAIQSHEEERAHAAELARRRERLVARIEAEVALLGSANLALIQARTGEAQNGRVELGTIAKQLETMLHQERDGAQLEDARAEVSVDVGSERPVEAEGAPDDEAAAAQTREPVSY